MEQATALRTIIAYAGGYYRYLATDGETVYAYHEDTISGDMLSESAAPEYDDTDCTWRPCLVSVHDRRLQVLYDPLWLLCSRR